MAKNEFMACSLVRDMLAKYRIRSSFPLTSTHGAGRGSRTKGVVALVTKQFRLCGPVVLKMAGRMPGRVALSVLWLVQVDERNRTEYTCISGF